MEIKTSRHWRCRQYGQYNRTVRFVCLQFFSPICSFFRDYTEFLEDLEEDPVLRQNVNVYKGLKKEKFVFFSESNRIFLLDEKKFQEISKENPSENDEDLPRIDLNEMLADMTVEDNNEMDS